jgi:hypothetical protein
VLSSQALLLTIATAFVLMAMAKERAGRLQKTIANRLAGIPGHGGLISNPTH